MTPVAPGSPHRAPTTAAAGAAVAVTVSVVVLVVTVVGVVVLVVWVVVGGGITGGATEPDAWALVRRSWASTCSPRNRPATKAIAPMSSTPSRTGSSTRGRSHDARRGVRGSPPSGEASAIDVRRVAFGSVPTSPEDGIEMCRASALAKSAQRS